MVDQPESGAPQVLYLEPDDEIPSVVRRLEDVRGTGPVDPGRSWTKQGDLERHWACACWPGEAPMPGSRYGWSPMRPRGWWPQMSA